MQGKLTIKLETLPKTWGDCCLKLLDEMAQIMLVPAGTCGDDENYCSDAPGLWDATVDRVDDEKIYMSGSAGPSGYGYFEGWVPRSHADQAYSLWIDFFNETEYEQYTTILRNHDVKWTEEVH